MSKPKRICIIGCGPCGMSVLYHFGKLPDNEIPEIVCYEKQKRWGGMWNVTWRTGLDEYGEQLHNGQYRNLWINSPKETIEYPDYTFEKHYGKAIPSYPPGPVVRNYIEGRIINNSTRDLRKFVKFSTIVRGVDYHSDTDDFTVRVKNLAEDRDEEEERFTHVIVSVGIFSVPNVPEFPGLDQFSGRVLHSHDFRDAREYKGKRILLIGSHYSAEDLSLQTLKFGATSAICSYRSQSMGFKWPKGVEERPLVERFDETRAYFRDGSLAEIDVLIYCTGYTKHYPFLGENLRLKSELTVFPDNLYRGVLWMKGGNRKLLYVGAQDQYYSLTMFDVEAKWACKYIMGALQIPKDDNVILEDIKRWKAKCDALKDCHDDIDFQTDFIEALSKDVGYPKEALGAKQQLHEWEDHKVEGICTFRDHQFRCLYTGTMSPLHHTPWMKAYDDSVATAVNQTPNKVTAP